MKSFRPLLILLIILALPTFACGLLQGEAPPEQPTEEPAPTNTVPPAPTETEVPPTATTEPTATAAAEPTQAPAPTEASSTGDNQTPPMVGSDVELSSARYEHPQDLFSLVPPSDWTVSDSEGAASFDAPDSSGFIYVQVTNTGYELDDAAFTNFVEHRDLNFFVDFDDYTEVAQEVDAETGVASVTKSLSFEGVPQTVITLYDQYGPIIYSYDFWSDEEHLDTYSDLYSQIVDTIEVNTEAASEQVEYNWIYTFTGPGSLFTIEVPTPWRYETTEGDVSIVDTFYSPDEHAVIQNITYDDGEEVSRSQAGAFALELLREYYASDIRILDDQLQPDGSERLIWESPSGDYSGTSFLESRGTTFLLFTTMYDNPFEDVYLETLDYTISTYEVPEEQQ